MLRRRPFSLLAGGYVVQPTKNRPDRSLRGSPFSVDGRLSFVSQLRGLGLLLALVAPMLPLPSLAASVEELAASCPACHGENGIPQEDTTPVIWGQNEGYIYLQLRDFKLGTRKSELMQPVAEALEKTDMRALAAHFSALKWPDRIQPSVPADIEKKALTVEESVGCTGCHQGEFQGDGTTGRLAGQNEAYLLKTAKDFRDGTRANNPGMTGILRSMNDDDISAVIKYVAAIRLQPSVGGR
jgi:cytochrome c553